MNIKPYVFSVIVLTGASASITHAAPPAGGATDQVAASFDRLLNHTATGTAAAVPATLTVDADPLRSELNAVLWDKPSYHLPVKYAQISRPSKSKNN